MIFLRFVVLTKCSGYRFSDSVCPGITSEASDRSLSDFIHLPVTLFQGNQFVFIFPIKILLLHDKKK